MKNLLSSAFTSQNGVVMQENGAQKLVVKRAPIGEKFLMENPLYTFTMQGPVEFEEYVVIEYSAFGIKRTPNVYMGPFMSLKKGEENIPLFLFDDMLCDKNTHTIIVKAPEGSFENLSMSFRVDKILESYFNITKLYTCKKHELPVCCEKGVTADAKAFTPIDISDKFDMEYDFSDFSSINDAGLFYPVHDFRTVICKTHTNLIFDIVLPFEYKAKNEDVILKVSEAVSKRKENCYCVITVDRG
jgi:hypothetical protein